MMLMRFARQRSRTGLAVFGAMAGWTLARGGAMALAQKYAPVELAGLAVATLGVGLIWWCGRRRREV